MSNPPRQPSHRGHDRTYMLRPSGTFVPDESQDFFSARHQQPIDNTFQYNYEGFAQNTAQHPSASGQYMMPGTMSELDQDLVALFGGEPGRYPSPAQFSPRASSLAYDDVLDMFIDTNPPPSTAPIPEAGPSGHLDDSLPDPPSGPLTKKAKACARCKKNKMRCVFSPGQSICDGCIRSKRECISVDRKPRVPEKRIIDLQSRVREKDQIIEELQEEIARRARSGRPSSDKSESEGHASKEDSPLATSPDVQQMIVMQYQPPLIIVHGVVTPQDVHELFGIFYQRMNPHMQFLDASILNISTVLARSPFLFTAICAIASRYLTDRPQMYPLAMRCAKHAAGEFLMNGWKNPEACQAYTLLSAWVTPSRDGKDNISLWAGVAARMAVDLNLHLPLEIRPDASMPSTSTSSSVASASERLHEQKNRQITYSICWDMDRELSLQKIQRPSSILSSPLFSHDATADDGMTNLLAIRTRLLDLMHVVLNERENSTSNSTNRLPIHTERLAMIKGDFTKLETRAGWSAGDTTILQNIRFSVEYYSLVMAVFNLDEQFGQGEGALNLRLTDASLILKLVVRVIAFQGNLRFTPEMILAQISAVAIFSLKLLQMHFSMYIETATRNISIDLLRRTISAMNDAAVDGEHSLRFYAQIIEDFLIFTTSAPGSGAGGFPPSTHAHRLSALLNAPFDLVVILRILIAPSA